MSLDGKIKNPISIRIGDFSNIMIEKDGEREDVPLEPGMMFGGEHYGFVLISDCNGVQRETIYPTQCSILALGIEGGVLLIFEDGKKSPWRFDKKGRIEHSPVDDFTDEALSKADIAVRNAGMFLDKPLLLNPVRIRIAKDPEKSLILRDGVSDCDYPLYPGAMLGGKQYGFLLQIERDGEPKEVAYPTQNRIEAVGIEGHHEGDLKIFEEGKYHPWVFTFNGKLKNESSYNQYSRKDISYVRERFGLDGVEDHFQLQKKKDK